MASMIELHSVSKSFGSGEAKTTALNAINFSVSAGELVAVMGPSGSGKSTLLTIAGGLERPTSGTVLVAGRDLSNATNAELTEFRRKTVGFVFQEFNLIPALTLLENVALPLELDGWRSSKARAEARRALADLEISNLEKRFPAEVSGGQRQRAAIARSFAGSRSLLLADEPTGALDSRTGEDVVRALRARVNQGTTAVMVTHDAKCAAWADRILTIRDGVLVGTSQADRRAEDLLL